jgi:16S rRNA (guanine966-N2)-methyltransferase
VGQWLAWFARVGFALFMDTDPEARAIITENVQACGAQGISRIWKRDAACLDPLPAQAGGEFDLVFIDPPYGRGLDALALAGLHKGWLAEGAIVMLERGRSEPALSQEGYEILDERDYGAARVMFLQLG